MTEPECEPSSEEITQMINCTRPAKYILWEGHGPSEAQGPSESGVPCGTELPPRGQIRGWEVCERCIKNPGLKLALCIGLKP